MYELKKIGKVFTSKFVGTGPSSYKKRIYRAAVSQSLRNTSVAHRVVCLRVHRDSDQELRRPRREAADSPTFSIDVKNAWSCTFIFFRFSWCSAKLNAEALLRYGPDNSVGIATAYGLDSPGIESRWRARFSTPVQSGPGAHPASYTMVPGLFGGKTAGAWR